MSEKAEEIQAGSRVAELLETVNNTSLKKHRKLVDSLSYLPGYFGIIHLGPSCNRLTDFDFLSTSLAIGPTFLLTRSIPIFRNSHPFHFLIPLSPFFPES